MKILTPRKVPIINNDSVFIINNLVVNPTQEEDLFDLNSPAKYISGDIYINDISNTQTLKFDIRKNEDNSTDLIVYAIAGFQYNIILVDFFDPINGIGFKVVNNEAYSLNISLNYRIIL